MKLKKIAIVIMSLCMTLLFTACEPNTNGGNGNEGEGTRTVIRFAAPEGSFGEEIVAFGKEFNKLNPNVTVRYEPISGDWNTKLLGQLGSGTAPDLFWLDEPYAFASKNVIEKLDPYFEKFDVDPADYHTSMLRYGQYNGHQYMLSREYNQVAVYYNKTIFDTVFKNTSAENLPYTPVAGTKYPANGWTWNEFVNTAKAIAQKDGRGNITRVGANISLSWAACGPIIFESLGGVLRVEDASGKESIDLFGSEAAKSANVSAVNMLKALMDEGALLNETSNSVGDFYAGSTGMFFASRPSASGVQEVFGENWDVVSFPTLSTNVHPAGSSGYVLNAASKNKELAAKLLFYIMSKEGQTIFMGTGNCVPILKELVDSPVWREVPRSNLNHDAFVYNTETDVLPYKFEFDNEIAVGKFDNAWKDAILSIFSGDKSTALALQYSHGQFQKIFS